MNPVTCFKCNKVGHYANECPNARAEGSNAPTADQAKAAEKGKAKVQALTQAEAADAEVIVGMFSF